MIITSSNLPDFYNDPIVRKYVTKLGLLVAESLVAKSLGVVELLDDLEAHKKVVRTQLQGRRLQLLKASQALQPLSELITD
jgi:hypothetical protein